MFKGNYRTEALRHVFEVRARLFACVVLCGLSPVVHAYRRGVWQVYCAFGGDSDATTMDRFKLHKILREAGLGSARLPAAEVDAVYAKVRAGDGEAAAGARDK